MKAYIYGWLLTLQFFSTIPLRKEIPMTSKNIERSIRMFPLFGLFLGTVYATVTYGLVNWTPFSPLLTAFILWILLIALTGGIHLDGWIDTSDAFFSYRDKEKRLEIMNDPHIGAFGVISVIVLLVAKFVLIFEIIVQIQFTTYLFIMIIPFLTRMLMGMILVGIPAAKKTGLAHMYQQTKQPGTIYVCVGYIVPILAGLWVWQINLLEMVLVLFLVTLCIFFYARRKIMPAFGGITGDVVGAVAEGAEVILWIAVLLFHYFVMG